MHNINLKQTYTLHFRIAEEMHTFTSRFNKLHKFHESLLKNEDFLRSFGYDPPDFPVKTSTKITKNILNTGMMTAKSVVYGLYETKTLPEESK